MQKNKRVWGKILSSVISATMVFTMFPVLTFATERNEMFLENRALAQNHTEHENCGYIQASGGQPCGHLNEDGSYSCAPVEGMDTASPSSGSKNYVCDHGDDCGFEIPAEGASCKFKAALRSETEDEIPVTEVNLSGREFSLTASVGEAPYYQVFKFTTPDGGGGSYTFYSEYIDEIDSYGYLCSESQYKALCKKIEAATRYVVAGSNECLISNDDGGMGLNFYINYNLIENTTYYFVGTRFRSNASGDYKLVFMRDIQINLDNQRAGSTGTENLYSKGNLWYSTSDRSGSPVTVIVKPEKEGYLFDGYYTETNGQGTQILDSEGTITEAAADFDLNTTVYAKWSVDPDAVLYTLTVNGSYAETRGSGDYGRNVEVSVNAGSRNGYTFSGWTSEGGGVFADANSPETLFIMPDGPVTITANWNYNGGSSSSDSEVWVVVPTSYNGLTNLIGDVRVPAYVVQGNWIKNDNGGWNFHDNTGKLYTDCWASIFNSHAKIPYDQNTYNWYKFDVSGNMITGWYTDGEGNTFYLNPGSGDTLGAMMTGWVLIDGKYYYFNEIADGSRGKLLKSTTTPDGYTVDENGVRNENN